MSELRDMLLSRGYKRKLIDQNIDKALLIPREEAIKRVIRKKDVDRVVFSVMYHPALPSIPRIIAKGYRTMVESDPHLKEVFLKTPGEADQSQGAPAPAPAPGPQHLAQASVQRH